MSTRVVRRAVKRGGVQTENRAIRLVEFIQRPVPILERFVIPSRMVERKLFLAIISI
jgi:hypothetical protein